MADFYCPEIKSRFRFVGGSLQELGFAILEHLRYPNGLV
jgi:hypothetical protein